MMLRLIKYLHDKIAKANVPLVAFGMFAFGILGFEGMVWYNQTSDFCVNCHVNRGPYRNIDLDSVAHKPYGNGEKTCLDCHTNKDFHVFAKEAVIAGAKGFARLTSDYRYQKFSTRNVTDDKCLSCHYEILDVNIADKLEISPRLAKIGLKFDHQRHFDFKEFRQDQAETLVELRSMNPGEYNDRQKEELALLEKIELAHCSRCHERNQVVDGEKGVKKIDREIHYYAQNPIGCVGCHVDAVTEAHPGSPLSAPLVLPKEETCRRCHNGIMHGRLAVFPSNCESTEKPFTDYCVKCHPGYGTMIINDDGPAKVNAGIPQ